MDSGVHVISPPHGHVVNEQTLPSLPDETISIE